MHQTKPKADETTVGLYQESTITTCFDYWLENPWTDTASAIIVFVVFLLVAVVPAPLTLIPYEIRHGLYQVAITASVTLLGLTMTSVSVLVNLIRAPLTSIDKVLKPEGKARLGVVFLSCMWAMLALLCASILAFAHDGERSGDIPVKWVELAFVVAAGFAAVRFVRIAAVLRLLITVV
ncbi:MAG TPA: hypothetical protein VMT95_00915 [Candidatus Binatia bacterium]|nr:hypothetical protein [Candidatus Binatia bacterium]